MENSKRKYKNHELLNTFGERLKELRTLLKLNQSEFGNNLKRKVPSSSISNYETGDTTPQLDFVYDVAETYNVSIDWLCGRTEEKEVSFKGINSLEFNNYSEVLACLLKMPNIRIHKNMIKGSCYSKESQEKERTEELRYKIVSSIIFEDSGFQDILSKIYDWQELVRKAIISQEDYKTLLSGYMNKQFKIPFQEVINGIACSNKEVFNSLFYYEDWFPMNDLEKNPSNPKYNEHPSNYQFNKYNGFQENTFRLPQLDRIHNEDGTLKEVSSKDKIVF